MNFIDDWKKAQKESDEKREEIKKHIAYWKSLVVCSECKKKNNPNNNYCIHCGHKLKKVHKDDKSYRQYCEFCGNQLKKDDDYCGECGKKVSKKVLKVKICPVCGKWCNENKYCWNCGHDNTENPIQWKHLSKKKCDNCNSYYDICYQYCNICGAKLKRRKDTIEEIKKGRDAFKEMNNKHWES